MMLLQETIPLMELQQFQIPVHLIYYLRIQLEIFLIPL